jgi:hypothetical protein
VIDKKPFMLKTIAFVLVMHNLWVKPITVCPSIENAAYSGCKACQPYNQFPKVIEIDITFLKEKNLDFKLG